MARLEGLAEVLAALDPPHASAAATGHGLGEHGKADPPAAATSVSMSVLGSALRSVGSPAFLAAAMARALLPVRCRTPGGGPTKVRVRGALLGEVRVLRQEAVAGVDRVG